MPTPGRITIAFKALLQLGISQLSLYGLYRFGLRTGHFQRLTDRDQVRLLKRSASAKFHPVSTIPAVTDLLEVLGESGRVQVLRQADEVVDGNCHLFAGDLTPLKLTFEQPLQPWSLYEKDPSLYTSLYGSIPDVKFIWEPARFGWAYLLGRAYHLSGDERYSHTFWDLTEQFLDANPPCLGPHWVSAQEVALRLMAFAWSLQVFSASPRSTPACTDRLVLAIVQHATRIPPTLVYARSQANNHLLSEAAGLFTAGLALPDHPQAARWRKLGWKWLNHAFQHQIDAYGEYTQHSTNYQRLMLQIALWIKPIARQHGFYFSRRTSETLALATHWLFSLLDPVSGSVPNLGANDGALIFPFSASPFADHRPVLQAAARSFMDYQLPAGSWDEMSLWFGFPASTRYFQPPRYLGDCLVGKDSWGYLRTVRYKSRPSHADQLHLDLWWRGLNITRDAGTYLYNVPSPWDNSLTHTSVHNTISVDGREQMNHVGRFLYLDWASGGQKHPIEADERILQRTIAWHTGYRRLGLRHERAVTVFNDEHWEVEDYLLFIRYHHPARTFRLHWLLPDWNWQLDERTSGFNLQLESPLGWISLQLSADQPQASLALVRAGQLIHGRSSPAPTGGWFSPTYGNKIPALSCSLELTSEIDVKFISTFTFPSSSSTI